MGLAVFHGIVTAHGGRREVESTPGKGSCFTLHLPRVPPPPESARSSPAAPMQPPRPSP
ncbi:ATP-binding protein [Cystobacter fuscus]|uniref:ATP-binding protein n=1 Tax=Cystobacter fuscus TaxID=43 RepID=UPI0012DEE679